MKGTINPKANKENKDYLSKIKKENQEPKETIVYLALVFY